MILWLSVWSVCSSALWLLGSVLAGIFLYWTELFFSLGSDAPQDKYCLLCWFSVRPVTMGSVVRLLTTVLKCRITAPVESVHCLYRPGLCLNRVGRRYCRSCIKNCLLLSGLNSLLGGQELCWPGNVTFAFFSLLDLAPRGRSRRLWFLQLQISFVSHCPWQIGISTSWLWNVMVEVLCCQGALKE